MVSEKELKVMNDRIREILSWYTSENPGVRTNLARMLNHGRLGGTGKMVILPVDQGFEHGPARSFAPNPVSGLPPSFVKISAGTSTLALVSGTSNRFQFAASAETSAGHRVTAVRTTSRIGLIRCTISWMVNQARHSRSPPRLTCFSRVDAANAEQ